MLTACLVFSVLVAIWGAPTPRLLKQLFAHTSADGEQPAKPVV